MNYRHIYHAGNFVDVFKHVVLIALIKALNKKDKPYCYIETHAGIGKYDLKSSEAQQTQEFNSGISPILEQKNNIPEIIQDYLQIIKNINSGKIQNLKFYPGSPRIVRELLRPEDRIILSELHPEDFLVLKKEFATDRQVSVYHQDGYLSLKALLPPKEKRGLIFIDPAYEVNNEAELIVSGLQNALKRFETGIYAVWYPLKNKKLTNDLYKKLKKLNHKEIIFTELSIYPEDVGNALYGSGMAIINPPWQLDQEIKILGEWLWKVLAPEKKGEFKIL